MAITSAGIGSGLDINSLVTQLVAAEAQAPTARLDRRQSDLQLRLSAYGQLKSSLSSLSSSLGNLKNFSTFRSYTATSSDSDVFTASSSGKVSKASYDVNVTALAKNHQLSTDPTLAGAQFTDVTDTLSTGTLTFKFGTTTYDSGTDVYTGFVQNPERAAATVTITDSSLEGVRNAINEADIGVTASLIFDGTNYRLSVSSDDTGADNSLEITVADDDGFTNDGSGLSLLSFNGTDNDLLQNEAGVNAGLTLNGIAITSSSNTVASAIDGVSLNLKTLGSASLNVDTDKTKVKTAITAFVASYNAFIGAVNQLTAYNPDTNTAGELNGDGVTRSITSNIQRLLSNPVGVLGSDFTILAEAGITTNPADGRLVINDTTLDKQLNDNFDKFITLFSAYGETTDIYTNFVSSTDDTTVGNYAVNITTLASRGDLVGSAAANLTITGGSNDVITLDIDGVSASVTLSAGTYTAAELVTELKTKINDNTDFSNAGISVDVTESAGVLSLVSRSYGSSSLVDITGGNGKTDLVGAAATSTAGVDVAGTIGGIAATGKGQLLTGTGVTSGLIVEITGATLGDRGSIDFKRGYAEQLGNYVDSLLASDGFFESSTSSLKGRLEDIADERTALADRLNLIETRLRSQFGALDALIAQLQNTSSFLQQQLSALPQIGGSNSR
ncbi:flagellar filament capping protein FliD [Sulfuriflexus mobilis]|uniref:flagellar filament capping protein FliD n=1 Tax=Sulfuriflexus mobilis TaxID=1811807 RepID=UPI000F82D5BA|nr:flagellar filament capping protein FliD [Sulfuriflexus mobilis]